MSVESIVMSLVKIPFKWLHILYVRKLVVKDDQLKNLIKLCNANELSNQIISKICAYCRMEPTNLDDIATLYSFLDNVEYHQYTKLSELIVESTPDQIAVYFNDMKPITKLIVILRLCFTNDRKTIPFLKQNQYINQMTTYAISQNTDMILTAICQLSKKIVNHKDPYPTLSDMS